MCVKNTSYWILVWFNYMSSFFNNWVRFEPSSSPGVCHMEKRTALHFHWGAQVYVRLHSLHYTAIQQHRFQIYRFPVHTGCELSKFWTLMVIAFPHGFCIRTKQKYCQSIRITIASDNKTKTLGTKVCVFLYI